MTHLTETTSNYSTDRNNCPERPFDATFYIATPRRLTTTDDNSRAILLCAFILGPSYLHVAAPPTNRNSGVAVNIACRVGGTTTLQGGGEGRVQSW